MSIKPVLVIMEKLNLTSHLNRHFKQIFSSPCALLTFKSNFSQWKIESLTTRIEWLLSISYFLNWTLDCSNLILLNFYSDLNYKPSRMPCKCNSKLPSNWLYRFFIQILTLTPFPLSNLLEPPHLINIWKCIICNISYYANIYIYMFTYINISLYTAVKVRVRVRLRMGSLGLVKVYYINS